jgi:hypothetical protein
MREGGLGVVGAVSSQPSAFTGCGVTGPVGAIGSRDEGAGVMRAPGSGVARAPGIGVERKREGGGGVYHVLAASASFGHPFGNHGTNIHVTRW